MRPRGNMSKLKKIRSLKEKLIKTATIDSGRVHVIPTLDKWAVSREGAKRKIRVTDTKTEALAEARKIKSASKIIIHNSDGKISKYEDIKK